MTTARTAGRPRSLIGRLLSGLATVLAAFLGAWLFSVLVEWVGLVFFWPEEGASRSAALLRQDLAWLTGQPGLARTGNELPTTRSELAATLAGGLHHWTMARTGLESVLVWLARASAGWEWLETFIQATLNASRLFLVRLSIAVLALPLFALMAVWGGPGRPRAPGLAPVWRRY